MEYIFINTKNANVKPCHETTQTSLNSPNIFRINYLVQLCKLIFLKTALLILNNPFSPETLRQPNKAEE